VKSRFVFAILIAISFVGLAAASLNRTEEPDDNFLKTRAELLMRDIGHKVLWYAGDSSSRVLPISRLNEHVFQIRFEEEFAFLPDTLIQIVDRSLNAARVPLSYRVSVFDCKNRQLVYGFEVMKQGSVMPCQGRAQPKGCYTLQIAFFDVVDSPDHDNYLFGFSLAIVTLLGLVGGRMLQKKKPVVERPASGAEHIITLGKYHFNVDRKILIAGPERIELSDKESRILKIFAEGQNQPIDRERLLKEVWEDEGVFVGRSLDVFVSKLRKKLHNDPSLRIVNIHGKGYKLEVD
jgi:Transcriptional regulatory protein, C terminal